MKKRFLSVLLVLALTLGILPCEVLAAPMPDGVGTALSEESETVTIAAATKSCTLENGAVLTYNDSGTITGCTLNGATEIVIPGEIDGVTITGIGYSVFNGQGNGGNLVSVTLPDSLTSIGSDAFYSCKKLTSIDFPEGLTTIGYNAFALSGLRSVHMPDSVTSIGDYAFRGCTSLASVDLSQGLTQIGYNVFSDTALTEVTIPSGVKSIGINAFAGCKSLISVNLPDGLTELKEAAFAYSGLTEITIPDSVTSFGQGVFEECRSLTSVRLPAGMTSIPNSMFQACTALESIELPNTVTTLEEDAFWGTALTGIDLSNVTEIGKNAFWNCDHLTEITLPAALTSVGNSAFADCRALASVYIYGRDTVFGDGVFRSAPNVTVYGYPYSTAQEYAENNAIPFVNIETVLRTLTVNVMTPAGERLTGGYSTSWYDENGAKIGSGDVLAGAAMFKFYTVEVVLDGELAELYEQPARQAVEQGEHGDATVQLVPLSVITLTGQVRDAGGNPLPGAAVTVSYSSGERSAVTGADGSFSLNVPRTVVSVRVSLDGYYSRAMSLYLGDKTADRHDLGVLALTGVISDRIVLSVIQRQAAAAEETPVETELASASALRVFLSRNGQPITDFEVQGLNVIFMPGVVSAGDVITVTVTDPTGQYADAAPVAVTLGENSIGAAEVVMTEKGSFILKGLDGPEATLLVFDSTGSGVYAGTAQAGVACGVMDAGSYTLILIQKSELVRGAPDLGYLDTLGLTAGTDYLRLPSVWIKNGVITELASCTVPELDESGFFYTVEENTSFTIYNKASGMIQGEVFLLRAAYELNRTAGASAQSLRIVLPEGIEVDTGSAAMVGIDNVPYTYSPADRTVTVSVANRSDAVVYLYCKATQSTGDHPISAYLALSGGAVQPLGTAIATVRDAGLEVVSVTSAKTTTVWGTAAPYSKVSVYDNDVLVGKTTANAAGRWQADIQLVEPTYTYSYHYIHAVAERSGNTVTTAKELLTYDESVPRLARITMYNQNISRYEQTNVFDFTDNSSTTVPHYEYYYPSFTFKAEFTGSPEDLSEVCIVAENSLGDLTYIETVYDEASGAWVGSYDFRKFSLAPVRVGAVYDFAGDVGNRRIDEEWDNDIVQDLQDNYNALEDMLTELYSDIFEVEYDADTQTGRIFCVDDETSREETLAQLAFDVITFPELTGEKLEEAGYELISVDDSTQWYREGVDADNNSVLLSIADLESKEVMLLTIDFMVDTAETAAANNLTTYSNSASPMRINAAQGWDAFTYELARWAPTAVSWLGYGANVALNWTVDKAATGFKKVLGLGQILGNLAMNPWIKYNSWQNVHNRMAGTEIDIREGLTSLLIWKDMRCNDTNQYRLSAADRSMLEGVMQDVEGQLSGYVSQKENWFAELSGALVGAQSTALFSLFMAKAASAAKPGKEATDFTRLTHFSDGLSLVAISNIIQQMYAEFSDWESREYASMRGKINSAIEYAQSHGTCKQTPNPKVKSPKKTVTPIVDPSGYVYEAVPSNHLEGVTATIYAQADGGAPWNAEDFDQLNPQITDANGVFQWDVPAGNWVVRFTKDGYEPADTASVSQAVDGWLPVPPPQLNILVGMTATAAPTVEWAEVFTDQAVVTFSQYMDIESVRESITVTVDGASVRVSVAALDAEYDLEGANQYATRFALIPTDAGQFTGGVIITVAGTAKNYAGKALGRNYISETLTPVAPMPTAIDLPETISIGLHELVNVSFKLLPGVAGQQLTVESLSPSLVDVGTSTVVTNANGEATIRLEGKLPGSGLVRITEPVSGVTATVNVDISLDAALGPVIAYLEDGTEVTGGMTLPAGTAVYLRASTEGAVIRYTLDDTCPCKEEALVYNGEPIIITENTVLRAAALKDDVYSATIRLDLLTWVNPFTDVFRSDWFFDGVAYTAQNGLMNGISTTVFAPYDTTNRAMIVTILYRLEQSPVTGSVSFDDVAPGTWYTEAVAWASANNIVNGYGNGNFGPNDSITREQIATILYRYASYKGYDMSELANLSSYTDAGAISDWALTAMRWANHENLITGRTTTTLVPNGTTTRAEAATILMRFCQNVAESG